MSKIEETFEDGLDTMRSTANAILWMLDRLGRKVDEATVKFRVILLLMVSLRGIRVGFGV